MSGKDERPKILKEPTFPECSRCTNFRYWIGERYKRDAIFFNPKEHQKKYGFLTIAIYADEFFDVGRIPTLEELADIRHIKCNACGYFLTAREQADMIEEVVNYIVGQG